MKIPIILRIKRNNVWKYTAYCIYSDVPLAMRDRISPWEGHKVRNRKMTPKMWRYKKLGDLKQDVLQYLVDKRNNNHKAQCLCSIKRYYNLDLLPYGRGQSLGVLLSKCSWVYTNYRWIRAQWVEVGWLSLKLGQGRERELFCHLQSDMCHEVMQTVLCWSSSYLF